MFAGPSANCWPTLMIARFDLPCYGQRSPNGGGGRIPELYPALGAPITDQTKSGESYNVPFSSIRWAGPYLWSAYQWARRHELIPTHDTSLSPTLGELAIVIHTQKMGSPEPYDDSAAVLLHRNHHKTSLRSRLSWCLAAVALICTTLLFTNSLPCQHKNHHAPSTLDVNKVQQCAIDNLKADLSFLDNAKPIGADEFLERRDKLARALHANGVNAFVLEPGYTFQYYGNISQVDWEPWEPEERPFLMLIMPQLNPDGQITAKTAFLSPSFEAGRVRMLGIPSRDEELDIEPSSS
ncbi:hypothetical protein NM208_g5223 [Fusarium decemcellulare]|uniref:Uncharacterized protein n=1 Tax=Fusarium decemcellulare TaxID=57161 RepID=A0ACC1SI42_9HYPO|nr:hypothetical protein NM208_g5223 [Fusarium decemcellulare]